MVYSLDTTTLKENEVGTKAYNLIQMKKNNFNVPKGIVLDKNCLNIALSYSNLTEDLQNIINSLTINNIDIVSSQISDLFDKVYFPQYLLDDIFSKLNKNLTYSVRSSGIKEDLKGFSFAGQYSTSLDIERQNIEEKIIDCYKSMYSKTVLTYLINNEINYNDLSIAVIIQEMIKADISGVCFTVHPTSGKDKEMLVELVDSIGEDLVSGKKNPSFYIYNWNEQQIIQNKTKLLTEKQIKSISKELIKIQLLFGYPCDIEFTIKNNKLYILQSRAITKFSHDNIKSMWTTANFRDGGISSTNCKPLMYSLYQYSWQYALENYLLNVKMLKEKEFDDVLINMFFGRCYWNVSMVKKGFERVPGYKESELDNELGIENIDNHEEKKTKIKINNIPYLISLCLAQNKILKNKIKSREEEQQALLKKYFEYETQINDCNIDQIKKIWYNLTNSGYLLSESTYFLQAYINTVQQSIDKAQLLKYITENEYLSLLSSVSHTSHMNIYYEILNVANKIKNDKEAMYYWKQPSDIIIKKLYDNKYFNEDVRNIIKKYGYHSDKELDIEYECYAENPHSIIHNIKSMINVDLIEHKKNDTQIILNRLKKRMIYPQYKFLLKRIKNMENRLWWREGFKDISTRYYYLIRIATLKLSQVLLKENIIQTTDDVFFLTITDLWDYIDNKISKEQLKSNLLKNKQYYNAFRNYTSENELMNIQYDKEQPVSNNKVLKGLSGNNGIIVGKARVINDISEINNIEQNEILVTKFTDTGWTPRFAIISGLVTECGGVLCHATIIAREYGIPAIMCCKNATKIIKTGQWIKINGNTGEVSIEKGEEND